MAKTPIKKTIKNSVVKTRDYVLSLKPAKDISTDERDYENQDTVYPWLNAIFTKLVNDPSGMYRPSYTWGVLHAAHLARSLGMKRISLVEFGVAGGNGLLSLEAAAQESEKLFGVGIDVYGFDTGTGLPKPEDFRDLPNLYKECAFSMDVTKLKKRLKKSRLMLGLVKDTISEFIRSAPAPIAFVSFDLDYYSSTMHAFKLLDAAPNVILPRIHCYFDDIMGFTHSDFTGERLAIQEFNNAHDFRKISLIHGLRHYLPTQMSHGEWPEKLYLAHIFDHPLYGVYDNLWRRPVGSWTDLKSHRK